MAWRAERPCEDAAVRILHVVAQSQRRGAEIAALDLAAELDARGHQDLLLALGPAFDGSTDRDLPVLAGAGRGLRLVVGSVRGLRRFVQTEGPDVVVVHGGWPAQVAAVALGRLGVTVVWQRILDFPPALWGSGRRQWWRAVAGRANGVVALTDTMADEMVRLGYRGQVRVIPNSRRPERFMTVDRAAASARLRAELGVAPDVTVVGLVGHLAAQKRPDRAVDVVAVLRAGGAAVHLVVAGTGPLRTDVERQVTELGLGDAVSFLGHRDDIDQVLGAVDVLLLTSDAEGIPGILIEAQMAGCPVVTVPVGGVAEVVEDGVTGAVLTSPEVAEMATNVLALTGSPELLTRMGTEARLRSKRFSTAVVAARYESFFEDLLAGR